MEFSSPGAGNQCAAACDARQAGSPATTVKSCAVCAKVNSSEATRATRPFAETLVAHEAIVDSLGFCMRHAPHAGPTQGDRLALATELRTATARIIDWFTDIDRYGDRIFDAFFACETTCPGCRLQDHQVASAVHDLLTRDRAAATAALCFAHYRDVVYASKADSLSALADAQSRLLDGTIAALGPRADGDQVAATGRHDAVVAALAVVAGAACCAHPADAAIVPGPVAVDRMLVDRWSAVERGICRVCRELSEEHARWLDIVHNAARFPEDRWIVFPTCAQHIADCAGLGNRGLSWQVAEHAASLQHSMLKSGRAILHRDIVSREAAKQSVFYRRISASYVLGRHRKMITALPRCPACERLAIAKERSVARLVHAARAGRHPGCADLDDLCIKHFASLYLLLPPDETRGHIASSRVDRLRDLRARLAGLGRESQPQKIDGGLADALGTWCSVVVPPMSSS